MKRLADNAYDNGARFVTNNFTPKRPSTAQMSDVTRRSLFGLLHCYNYLPQSVVDSKSVKIFQRKLQETLKVHCTMMAGDDWQRLFTMGWKSLSRIAFDNLFD